MEYTTLGDTGVTVSRICLGCMSFGSSDWRDWVLDEKAGLELVERAIDLGINFFDSANMYRPHEEVDTTTRGQTDSHAQNHPYFEGGGREINERVQQLAEDKGATMAQIGLAWILGKEWMTAPIVGTTSIEHLEEAVEALDITLSDSDVEYMEEPYEPVRVSGH